MATASQGVKRYVDLYGSGQYEGVNSSEVSMTLGCFLAPQSAMNLSKHGITFFAHVLQLIIFVNKRSWLVSKCAGKRTTLALIPGGNQWKPKSNLVQGNAKIPEDKTP